jgi:hypothetical protein
VVPKKPLQQLRGTLPTDESILTLAYNNSHLFVKGEHVSLSCRLIDARFPDYRAVIPVDNPYRLTINRADFASALRRIDDEVGQTLIALALDVARKLVILSREWGREIELADVDLIGLVPPELSEIDRDAFLARAAELDAPMLERFTQARSRGCVLRFVAHVDAETASVGLVELPKDHAFAHLKPTDNIIQFTSARYSGNPLVVQGPGAGPEVTAAGVFADLLRVAQGLGTRL